MTAWEIASIIIIGGLMAALAVVINSAAHERDRLMQLLTAARRDADAARKDTALALTERDTAIEARKAAEKSELEMSENVARLRARPAADWPGYVFKLHYSETLDARFPAALHCALEIAEKSILRRWSEKALNEQERVWKFVEEEIKI